jgi:hypothetical protein
VSGEAPGAPGDPAVSGGGAGTARTEESVAACRALIVRIFAETLPELTRSYRPVPDAMARLVIREYLSSERKQDTMVSFFLNSKVFQKLSPDERRTLSVCNSDDFLSGLEPYLGLPKVRLIRDVLREREAVFEEALQRGKRRLGWV